MSKKFLSYTILHPATFVTPKLQNFLQNTLKINAFCKENLLGLRSCFMKQHKFLSQFFAINFLEHCCQAFKISEKRGERCWRRKIHERERWEAKLQCYRQGKSMEVPDGRDHEWRKLMGSYDRSKCSRRTNWEG